MKKLTILLLFISCSVFGQNQDWIKNHANSWQGLTNAQKKDSIVKYFDKLIADFKQQKQRQDNDSIVTFQQQAAKKANLISKLVAKGYDGTGSLSDWRKMYKDNQDIFGDYEKRGKVLAKEHYDEGVSQNNQLMNLLNFYRQHKNDIE